MIYLSKKEYYPLIGFNPDFVSMIKANEYSVDIFVVDAEKIHLDLTNPVDLEDWNRIKNLIY